MQNQLRKSVGLLEKGATFCLQRSNSKRQILLHGVKSSVVVNYLNRRNTVLIDERLDSRFPWLYNATAAAHVQQKVICVRWPRPLPCREERGSSRHISLVSAAFCGSDGGRRRVLCDVDGSLSCCLILRVAADHSICVSAWPARTNCITPTNDFSNASKRFYRNR